MATQKFSNNASALLAASINASDLTIQVASGFGTLFPSPGAGEFFIVALQNAAGSLELVKISSRVGDNLTVAASGRGQESTTAAAWTLNVTRVELRTTATTLSRMVQQEAGVVTIDITIPNLTVSGNAIVTTSLTVATVSVRDAGILTSGTIATARLGTGGGANTFLAGNQTFQTVNFTQLGGSASNAQVPQAAVTQHQAALAIATSQVTSGTFADARIAASNVTQYQAQIKGKNVTGLAGVAVTLQSDPGGTPSGSAGDIFYYY